MPYNPNNIFAKIVRGEAPCYKVYEDDKTLAFMDIMPQVEGHTLVVPKEIAENIFDLSQEGAASLIDTTRKLAAGVQEATSAPGILIAQLNGAAAGQSVFHIHFHVMPRYSGIDLKIYAREPADVEKLKALAAKIAAAIR